MRKATAGLAAVLLILCTAPASWAEKLKGYVWEVQGPLIVEGIEVVLRPGAKIERKRHRDITRADLRIGWEVEVEGEVEGRRFLAKKLKVKTERDKKVKLEGYVEAVSAETFDVEGRRVRWSQELSPNDLVAGMELKGKGILLDDGTVSLEKFELKPWRREKGEEDFLALADAELEKLKENLEFYDDRLFQEYIARVGHSLVPEWVDRNEIQFNFSIIDDPSLNAFALPDGTVVVHTGLLATLENEAQLATVLGHEIAHVTHKHGYRGYNRAKKLQWVALGAAIAGAAIDANAGRKPWEGPSWGSALVEIGAALSLTAAVNGHGRNMEDDADRIGLNYAIDAGYDPFEAPEVWHIFTRHTGDRNSVSNWFFSDHSTHRARISNLTREINQFYRGRLAGRELRRNADEYNRMIERLRRHNAVRDYETKEYRNAEVAFRRILESDPEDATAHLYLGKILWDTQGASAGPEALEYLKRAAELDPAFPDPYREMGFIQYSLGDPASAVDSFRTYLDMAPNAPDAGEVRGYLRDIGP